MPSGSIFSPVYYANVEDQRKKVLASRHGDIDTHEFVVFEVADDLLRVRLRAFLESLNLIGLVLLEVSLDGLHVALQKLARRMSV